MTIPFYRFLEVGAYSLLSLMPFLSLALHLFLKQLRFSRWGTHVMLILLAILQIGLGYAAAFSPVGIDTITLISTVIYVGFYFGMLKDHPGRLCYVLLVVLNLANLVTVCAKCLEGMLFGDMALESYRWSLLLCLLIMHGTITVPTTFYILKTFTSSVPIETRTWRYLWLIPATFYVIWYYHLYFIGENDVLVAMDLHNAVFLIVITLGAFVVYHMVNLLLLEQQKSAQLMQDNYLLSLHEMQYENLQQRINEARRAKHDVHHHTHLIREYLKDGKLKELEAYLDEYSAALPDTQSILYCRHYETNTILSYFAQQARDHGIVMDVFVQLPEQLRLPGTTLSVLLGNLLENAIDACKELPEGDRKITVRGKANCGFVYFDVSNTYSGVPPKKKNGEYLSTKKNGQGLGLRSVAELVNRHGGVVETDTTPNIFRVSVMLQEQTDA